MKIFTSIIINRKLSALISVGMFLLAMLAIVSLGKAENQSSPTDTLPQGAESTRVVEIQEELAGNQSIPAIILASLNNLTPIPDSQIGQANMLVDTLQEFAMPGQRVSPPILSDTEKYFIIIVPLEDIGNISAVEEEVASIEAIAKETMGPDFTIKITGGAGVLADIAKSFAGTDTTLLLTTASIVILLLLITYRSPFLWIIPLLTVGTADQLAGIIAPRVAGIFGLPVDESATGILSVIVFGAGTNYSLLLISRYKDELRLHKDRFIAMRTTISKVSEAILSSGVTVILGLLTLLFSLLPNLRGLGLVSAVGIGIALIFVLIVLPAFLLIFDRKIFWPLIPHVGDIVSSEKNGAWHKIGTFCAKKPLRMVFACLIVIGILSAGAINMPVGLSSSQQFLKEPQSISASKIIAEEFGKDFSGNITIIGPVEEADSIMSRIENVPEFNVPQKDISNDTWVQINVATAVSIENQEESYAEIFHIRDILQDISKVYVGGSVAQDIDYDIAASRDNMILMPLILFLIFLVLWMLLKSVVASVFLIGTLVLTYFAALGAGWTIFSNIFEFPALSSSVQILAFLFLVSLGVDYNIFLTTRARQEARKLGSSAGMLSALSATGVVITSAGILLAAVFTVLSVLPVVSLTQIGIIVCIGVLLDTLLVRTVLVPSLVFWLGDKFWWPNSPHVLDSETK